MKWKTEKEKALFAFLFQNIGTSIHKDRIIEALWSEIDYKRNLIHLQTTISRLRNSLRNLGGNFKIDYSNNRYQMSMENVECDVFEFDRLMNKCKIIDKNKIDIVDKIMELYTGDYLAEESYLWAIPIEEKLRKRYLDLLMNLSECLIKDEKYKIALKYLNIIVEKNPYNVEVNNMILLVYDKLKDIYSMTKHYNSIQLILKDEYDAELPLKIKELFLEIYKKHTGRKFF